MPDGTIRTTLPQEAGHALAALAALPPDALARHLRNEYPQTVALLLDRIPDALTSAVLAELPTSFAAEIVLRMLRLEAVRPDVEAMVTVALAAGLPPHGNRSDVSARHGRMGAILRSAPDVAAAVAERIGPARALDLGLGPAEEPKDHPRLRVPCGQRRITPTQPPAPRPRDGHTAPDDVSLDVILTDIRRIIGVDTGIPRARPQALAPDEALAAACASLADDGPAASPAIAAQAPSTDDLDQDGIDSLLGFKPKGHRPSGGILALTCDERPMRDRLAMVEPILKRFGAAFAKTLRTWLDVDAEIMVDQISTVRFADCTDRIPLPAMLGIFRAEEWSGRGLIIADSALIYSLVDLLLGGRRGAAALRIEGRPYTSVERTLVGQGMRLLLADLAAAFGAVAPVTLPFERMETNPRFADIEHPNGTTLVIKLRVDLEDRGGRLEIAIPHSTLDPIREVLRQNWIGERIGHDPLWGPHVERVLAATPANATAVLGERMASFSEILAWKTGSTILLNEPASPLCATLQAPGLPIAQGAILRRLGRFALRVDHLLLAGDPPPRPPVQPFAPCPRSGDQIMPHAAPAAMPPLDIGAVADAKVKISALLGGTEMTFAQIIALGRGAVIELDHGVNDPIDLLVNDTPFARGEIAIVEDRVAVVITELRARPQG